MYKILPFLLLFSFGLRAQTPQKVYRITKEMKKPEWYQEQIQAWKKVVEKNPKNGDAWMNYYWATRAGGQVSGGPWPQAEMEKVVEGVQKAMPNSFEYYFLASFTNGSDFDAKLEMLKKAYEADPSRLELNEELALQYEIKRNLGKRKEFNIKWFQSNELSPHLLAINYNVLMSLDRNAVVITHGDNDTMPLWLLQDALGIRPDVTVINASLVNLPKYRAKLLDHLGIPKTIAENMKPDVPSIVKFLYAESNSPTMYKSDLMDSYKLSFKVSTI
ncbi:MAG: hypothetical protein AAFR87_14655 [Bacteroidota bacterium]